MSNEKSENTNTPIYEFDGNTCVITIAYLDAFTTKNPLEDPKLISLLGTKYTKVIYDLVGLPIDNIPNGVTHLNITHPCFNIPVNNLPSSLIYLRIGGMTNEESLFNQPLNFLPLGLKILILEKLDDYTHPLNNLPPNLEYLYILNCEYKHELNNLPLSLKKVHKLNYLNGYNYNYLTYSDFTHLWDLATS
jgi:hypothetical protein